MFAYVFKDGPKALSFCVLGAAALIACSGQALAQPVSDNTRSQLQRGSQQWANNYGRDDRGSSRGGQSDRGGNRYDRGHDRGYDRHRDNDRTRVSINVGINSGYSSFGYSRSNSCDWRSNSWGWRRDYCPTPVVIAPCPPPVYVAPCPPRPVVITPRCDDDWSVRRVVVERPVYVERPVVIERPVERVVERQVIVDRPVIVEKPVYVEQQPIGNVEAGRYQDRELGDAYLRVADADNAIRAYRRYLAAWNQDGTVTRNLGFAQILRGDVQDGFRAVVSGYKMETGLIDRPIRVQDLGGNFGFQRLLDAASRGADGTNTAEGWLTVAILQDLAGQSESAVNALQRARNAGLEQTLLDRFTLKLNRARS